MEFLNAPSERVSQDDGAGLLERADLATAVARTAFSGHCPTGATIHEIDNDRPAWTAGSSPNSAMDSGLVTSQASRACTLDGRGERIRVALVPPWKQVFRFLELTRKQRRVARPSGRAPSPSRVGLVRCSRAREPHDAIRSAS